MNVLQNCTGKWFLMKIIDKSSFSCRFFTVAVHLKMVGGQKLAGFFLFKKNDLCKIEGVI